MRRFFSVTYCSKDTELLNIILELNPGETANDLTFRSKINAAHNNNPEIKVCLKVFSWFEF